MAFNSIKAIKELKSYNIFSFTFLDHFTVEAKKLIFKIFTISFSFVSLNILTT